MTEVEAPVSLGDVVPKMRLRGTVKQIQLAGALIDVGLEECDAFLHISQIRRRRRVKNVSDALALDQHVTVWVLSVDREAPRLDVTMIEPPQVSWDDLAAGQVYSGKVVRIEKFGVFVDIGAERPGLVHISELAHDYVNDPGEVVEKGQDVEVQVIGVNHEKNQIDLSMKALAKPAAAQEEAPVAAPQPSQHEEPQTAMALALQRAMAESAAEKKTGGKEKESNKRKTQDDILRRSLDRHRSS